VIDTEVGREDYGSIPANFKHARKGNKLKTKIIMIRKLFAHL
jgi:hypothetical protein